MPTPAPQSSVMLQPSGKAKRVQVQKLLDRLKADLKQECMLSSERDATLEELKVYGRNPENADPIFTKEGIQVLSKIAFNNSSDTTCQNALRCLANAMLLRPPTRQIFVDLEYESKACDRLKNDSRDDEFLVSRILFLTTYGTSVNLEGLIDQRHLAVTINQNLRRHEESIDTKKSSNQMEEMALIETLKLLFNITHFCPQRSHTFTPAVKSIVALTHGRPIQASDPLSASMGPLINSLINIEISGNEEVIQALFPDQDPTTFTSKLIELLDVSTTSYTDAEIEQQTLPLLTLLRKIHESAPENIKVFMMEKILPNDEDRKQVLGQTASLPSRLLKLSTSPLAPQSREAISNLLFEMSDKNASTFVHNVGYGFASGFLFQHNISIPDDALNSTSTNSTPQIPVNPVTGQRMDREAASEGPEMTQEEKEREAEKLMVLFERLKANGIIDVENPVHRAAAEGRFQELDSDDESE